MPFRLKCFLSHLLFSSVIAVLSLILIFKIWYPSPLHIGLGVGYITLMMIAIDVILGPLLTLLIAKEGKKELKYDLIFIGIIQLSALIFGIHSIEKSRPVWMVFDYNRFELVQKPMIVREDSKSTLPDFKSETWLSPKWSAVRAPKDEQEKSDWFELEINGISTAVSPALYEPIESSMDRIIKEKLPLSDLDKYNDSQEVKLVLSNYPQADGFLPMRTSLLGLTVLIDSENKQIVEVVDLRSF